MMGISFCGRMPESRVVNLGGGEILEDFEIFPRQELLLVGVVGLASSPFTPSGP